MLTNIEFYIGPDGSVNIKPLNEPMYVYEQKCRNITDEMIVLIRDLYPKAFAALSKIYSSTERNKDLYEYKIVHRFIRCNLGEYDALSFDINHNGAINLEMVKCPLRGECVHECVICRPELNSVLSAREQEVAELLGKGLNRQEIADELYISAYTVSRHIDNIKARLGIKSTQQIAVRYAQK